MILIPLADIMPKRRPPGAQPSKLAEPCLLCGRWVLVEGAPTSRGVEFVELTTDGCIVWNPDGAAVPSVPNSQGAFPVGRDCYRKIAAAARNLVR